MSAIEVLKELQDGLSFDYPVVAGKIIQYEQALDEALLALEQKEIAKVRIEELKADIEMLKAENKELIDKLNACENRCYVLESELK